MLGEGCKTNPFSCLVLEKAAGIESCWKVGTWGQNQDMTEACTEG